MIDIVIPAFITQTVYEFELVFRRNSFKISHICQKRYEFKHYINHSCLLLILWLNPHLSEKKIVFETTSITKFSKVASTQFWMNSAHLRHRQ
jgi:hypothetical protein